MRNIVFKNNSFIKFSLAGLLFFTACEDKSIEGPSSINEDMYQGSDASFAYLIDEEGKKNSSLVEFRKEGTTNVYVALSKGAESEVTGTLKYNESALEAYNSEHETNYKAFPENLVEFNGALQIAKGTLKSKKISIRLKTGNVLDSQQTYVLPLSIELTSKEVSLSEVGTNYLLFIKDLSKIPDPKKVPDPQKFPEGIKIFNCMEGNETANPLNNLCFKLKNSGKPLIDAVILFGININYNADEGRVYVQLNDYWTHILNNRKKYLKPLQDAGMKVILGLLGNHDHTGIANLSDETARDYAQELKAVCDAYHLDGVFFDDEYSSYKGEAPEGYSEGFVSPSPRAASRLLYETKQAMPDRLVIAYVYSNTKSLNAVDGHEAGTYVDYGLNDYPRSYDLSEKYPGMPKSRMGLYSQEFEQGMYASQRKLEDLRTNGYGAHMIFAMDANRGGPYDDKHRGRFINKQYKALQLLAKVLYDDELETYDKDGNKMDKDHIDQSKFYKKDF